MNYDPYRIDRHAFEIKMFQHIESTNGVGCGDINCLYCATWSNHLRDEEITEDE